MGVITEDRLFTGRDRPGLLSTRKRKIYVRFVSLGIPWGGY